MGVGRCGGGSKDSKTDIKAECALFSVCGKRYLPVLYVNDLRLRVKVITGSNEMCLMPCGRLNDGTWRTVPVRRKNCA